MMRHAPKPCFYIATNKFFIVVSKRSIKWDSLIASLRVSYWCIKFTYTLARVHSYLSWYCALRYLSMSLYKSVRASWNIIMLCETSMDGKNSNSISCQTMLESMMWTCMLKWCWVISAFPATYSGPFFAKKSLHVYVLLVY